MPQHPLAEVFGYPTDNSSEEAKRHRKLRLCPFNNKVPNCTKDKANDPLGVCSIYTDNANTTITCPIRFREGWIIAEDAASFFFPPDTQWTSLTEVRLKDVNGESAGNIDVVLVAYDDKGKVTDFGALEVQAVYISGNVRRPFEHYMEDQDGRGSFVWRGQTNYPKADYLSSSRKRLVPQIIFKGGILHQWQKKSAVALTQGFFDTLPQMDAVDPADAEIAWMIYDLDLNKESNQFQLVRKNVLYTRFKESLVKVSQPLPGNVDVFLEVLQGKLDRQNSDGERNAPDAPTLDQLL